METDIRRYHRGEWEPARDTVADEVPLTIHLDGRELVTIACSPHGWPELCTGFLFSSGFIRSAADIAELTVDEPRKLAHLKLQRPIADPDRQWKRMLTPGCGRGVVFFSESDLRQLHTIESDFTIATGQLLDLMAEFQSRSVAYQQTGGVHSAALSDGKRLVIFQEDIGRHNAVDKVIGQALREGRELAQLIALASGRISSDLIHKVIAAGCPLLASKSAPTDQAVLLSRTVNLTLAGFARGRRMNVYSGAARLTG